MHAVNVYLYTSLAAALRLVIADLTVVFLNINNNLGQVCEYMQHVVSGVSTAESLRYLVI